MFEKVYTILLTGSLTLLSRALATTSLSSGGKGGYKGGGGNAMFTEKSEDCTTFMPKKCFFLFLKCKIVTIVILFIRTTFNAIPQLANGCSNRGVQF